jgi:hypothetical protein
VRKNPILKIGVVLSCTDATVKFRNRSRTKSSSSNFSRSDLAGANGRSLIHAPQCNPESPTLRGNYSARLSFARRLSFAALALISTANTFAGRTVQSASVH